MSGIRKNRLANNALHLTEDTHTVRTVSNGHVGSVVGATKEGCEDDHQVDYVSVIGRCRCEVVKKREQGADLEGEGLENAT